MAFLGSSSAIQWDQQANVGRKLQLFLNSPCGSRGVRRVVLAAEDCFQPGILAVDEILELLIDGLSMLSNASARVIEHGKQRCLLFMS
jgi:hypothetical protein